MYKVFYNQRTVLFTENVDKPDQKSFEVYPFENKDNLKKEIDRFIEESSSDILFIIHDNIDYTFGEFCKLHTLIEAGGGLVKNQNNESLFIYRREKWDLPKGKIEANEAPETGAVREVEEECGIHNPKIISELAITYHTYTLNNKDILKRTYWYEMFYNGNELLKPQLEEEITKAVWLKDSEINKVTQNTFPSIIDVIENCRRKDKI